MTVDSTRLDGPLSGERTRRALLKTVGGAAALAATGTGTAAAADDSAFMKLIFQSTRTEN